MGCICLVKKVRAAKVFFAWRSTRKVGGGGGYWKSKGSKALRLEMVVVDDLAEKYVLMMKIFWYQEEV